MKLSVLCLFAFLALAAAGDYKKDGDVLVLTDDTINEAIKEFEFLLVEFYAPWCGHCKSLEPEYAKAATALAALDTPIPIAKVDATENTESAGQHEVRGYPTLKWFVNGKATEYTGGRTEAEIVQWVKKKSGPPCAPLSDKSAVEKFTKDADVSVVGFMSSDSDEFKTLEEVARGNDDVAFGVVTDEAVAGEFEAKFPGAIVFRNFDDGNLNYDGDFTAEALGEFIAGNSIPLISTFSQESASKIFGSGVDNHFLYFGDADADYHTKTMDEMRTVAAEFKGKTLFVFVPHTEDRVMSYFDFTPADLPKAIQVSLGEGDMKKYAFEKDLDADNFRAHVAAYHSGELKPTLKSEEEPADNSGPVTVIVGTNFEQIALDDTKDVLVEFYAPWCGHCKALAPTWEKLGEKYQDQESVVIAKVDATANDIVADGVNVRGFPTILFFGAGGAEPVTYEGGRDLDDFVKYIEENASTLKSGDKADGKAKEEL